MRRLRWLLSLALVLALPLVGDTQSGHFLPSYTTAGLPAAGYDARVARVTDGTKGLWMDQGTLWFPLNGNVYNVQDFGAKCDNSTNDASAIQAALTAAVSANGGVVSSPSGKTCRYTTGISIPNGAQNIIINGYNSTWSCATLNGVCLTVSDYTTQNSSAMNIVINGLTLAGAGSDATAYATYPNQTGMDVGAVQGLTLRDVKITSMANTGFKGAKPTAAGSTYWTMVRFYNTAITFAGRKCVDIGATQADRGTVDDFVAVGFLFNNCGRAVNAPDNGSHAAVYLRTQVATLLGGEISAALSANGVGGLLTGLDIDGGTSAGAVTLIGTHFESNGNNQAGSQDVRIEGATASVLAEGTDHFGNVANSAKVGFNALQGGLTIVSPHFENGGTHSYDYGVTSQSGTLFHISSPIRQQIGTFNTAAYSIDAAAGANIGSFTLAAAATKAVANIAITATSKVAMIPTNASAGTLMGSSKSLYVSALTPGTGFTVATADGTNAAGTETFSYQLVP